MWLTLHQTGINGDVVRSVCSVQRHPCIYPGHVAVTLKAGPNSAGCVQFLLLPFHHEVAPSESLGLGDFVVTCSDGSFIASA